MLFATCHAMDVGASTAFVWVAEGRGEVMDSVVTATYYCGHAEHLAEEFVQELGAPVLEVAAPLAGVRDVVVPRRVA